MNIPKFDQWSIREEDQSEEPVRKIKTDGSFDADLQKLQKDLNIIFADLPKTTGGTLLDPDGRYGKRTKARIKDFQLLLRSVFSQSGAKLVPVDGIPSNAILTTARDIAKMGNQKAFSLK
jgi:hypothetical protein